MTAGNLATRWAPPTVFALLVVVGVLNHSADAPRIVAALVAVVAMLTVRPDRHPLAMFVAVAIAMLAVGVVCDGASSNIGWFANVVAIGWLAFLSPWPVWLPAWLIAAGVLAYEWIESEDIGWGPWLAGTTFSALACWQTRRQHDTAEQLRAAQAGLAERAKAEERNRIARELHDAVAHSLTVSLLHVTSARLAVEDDDREEAARVLEVAERVGRAALAEVRQAVGMLRSHETHGIGAPLPDATQLAALVETVHAAGAPGSYTASGDAAALPKTLGVVLYRILQEALTNAVRHAPGVPTAVWLNASGTQVAMTVDTAPLLAPPPAPAHTGTGLDSMRERAQAVGGTCTAGRHADGWCVQVVIPVRDTTSVTTQETASGVPR
jgi:signal transduction histidine kinase